MADQLSQSQRLGQEAERDSRFAIVEQGLRSRAGLLRSGGVIGSTPPTDAEWTAMAREVVERRTLRGRPLREYDPELETMMGQVDRMAVHFREATTEYTGDFEFLQGATIGQAFRGLGKYIQKHGLMAGLGVIFSAIFGGGGNSPELTELRQDVARETATAVSGDLRRRLEADTSLGLSPENINRMVHQTESRILARVGLPPNPLPAGVDNGAPTGALSEADNTRIRGQIRTRVMTNFGLKEENGVIVRDPANTAGNAMLTQFIAARFGQPEITPDQLRGLVDNITNATHHAATSPDLQRNPTENDTQYATRVRDAVEARLTENAAAMGLGGLPPEVQRKMIRVMANETTVAYLRARPVDRDAGNVFAAQVDPENIQLRNQITAATIERTVGPLPTATETLDFLRNAPTNISNFLSSRRTSAPVPAPAPQPANPMDTLPIPDELRPLDTGAGPFPGGVRRR